MVPRFGLTRTAHPQVLPIAANSCARACFSRGKRCQSRRRWAFPVWPVARHRRRAHDSPSRSCLISVSRRSSPTTSTRQLIDNVLDIAFRRASRTTRDEARRSRARSRARRAISFYRLALVPELVRSGEFSPAGVRQSVDVAAVTETTTRGGVRCEHHDRSRPTCYDACWQGRKLPLAP